MLSEQGRLRLATTMVIVAAGLSIVAVTLSYGARAVLRPSPFADRAAAALRQPAVRTEVADRLSDAIVQAGSGDLVTIRPIVRALSGSVVSSRAFAALLRRAAYEAHLAVVEHHGGTMFVTVADAGVLLQGALKRIAPSAARTVGAERAQRLLTLHPGDGVLEVIRIAGAVSKLAWLLALCALLLVAGAVALSPAWRRTLRGFGVGLALGGLVLVALCTVGGAVAAQLAPAGQGAVVAALWWAFLGGLRVQALWIAVAGTIVAASASGRLGAVRGAVTPRALWPRLSGGDAPEAITLTASIAVLAAGAAIVLEPAAALRVGAIAAGLYAVYRGVEGILAWGREHAAAMGAAAGRGLGWTRHAARWVPVALGVAALAAAASLVASGSGDEAPAATPTTCNGFLALCDRRLNDVAFAATHNSYASVTIPSFLFGQQDGTIADQLQFGIRGLLIDTYYGDKVSGGVRTDLGSAPKREAATQEIGAPAVEAGLRIRKRLQRGGKGMRGIFLCHALCELGAVSLSSALADLRTFLVSHPGDVVVVINQDEGVSPADIATAFKRAGLLDLVYRGPLGPFPTLRTMIDSDERLVVMAENDAGQIPWYHLAYKRALQETPYRFTSTKALTDPSQLDASCRPNRGPASAPLLLLNNWVDTTPAPRASNADVVNARQTLLTRAERCRQIRDRLPNLVAVDFFRRGDVLGVVNALNGVSDPRTQPN